MIVISAENVGKAYRLGTIGTRTLQEDVSKAWARLRGRPDPSAPVGTVARTNGPDRFWALRDVSFQVERGDVIGIIGRNGAGKSTLLKILSQVTAPTTGTIDIVGRIASLLEVGTGFHPELSGRENVFLNGNILGMTTSEVRRKFDEIVAFSGVEEFIDTPVKRYSSGMTVRLAFAVAAHLEPDILIVDEVLAVGDAAFQRKCIQKMSEVSNQGRTILFVSHDLSNVSRLCNRGLLLNSGQVEAAGPIAEIIAKYRAEDTRSMNGFGDLRRRAERSGTGDARFESIELLANGVRSSVFEFGGVFTAVIRLGVERPLVGADIAATITTPDGVRVHEFYGRDGKLDWDGTIGLHSFTMTVPNLHLYPGEYQVELWLADHDRHRVDFVQDAVRFHVVQTSAASVRRPLDRQWSMVYQPADWTHACRRDDGHPACSPDATSTAAR